MDRFSVGDEVRIDMGPYWHTGTFVGWRPEDGLEMFIHNAKMGGVILSTAQHFSGGRRIHFVKHGPQGREHAVVERLFGMLGQKYNLLFHNCEHVSSVARTGEARSPSVVKAAGVLGFLTFVGGVLHLATSPTKDANGRAHDRRTGRFV